MLGLAVQRGKKIVAWDVGYGFRPNDFVEQERAAPCSASTPEGRPVLTAEHFDASTAVDLRARQPDQPARRRGADEPALAARVYRATAHSTGTASRAGARTGASAGAARRLGGERIARAARVGALLERADTLAIDRLAGTDW
jgi:hypothetical protein